MSTQAPAREPAEPSRAGGWGLRRRLSATFVVLGAMVVIGTVLAAFALTSVNSAQRRQVDKLDPAIQASNDFFLALVNQETGLRGFALTHEPLFLEPYATGLRGARTDLATLRATVGGDPRLSADVEALARAAEAWQTQYAAPALATISATPVGRIPAVDFTRGKTLFDTIRTRNTTLASHFADARRQARDQLRHATLWLMGLVAGATVMAAVISVTLWIALRRWILEPLGTLRREVRVVAAGDLEHPVTTGGPPDIMRLAADAELMRGRMLTQYQAAVAARGQAQASAALAAQHAQDLRRSNAELEQFAYIASHDLQEPLRKVASFCQMLDRRYSGQLDERADQYISFAVDGAKRMQSLINDLLAFSRVGRTTATFKPVDLNECVTAAIGDLETLLTETATTVEVRELPTVPGDMSLLRQLFINLIGNAVKFRDEPAPHVTISSITVEGGQDGEEGQFASVTVSDNGIGIDPRYAEKVFAIFARLHGRDRYEGTGIGLALCRKIVEFHGGSINVVPPGADGAPERGATLRFTLPFTTRPTVPEATSVAAGSFRTEDS